MVGAGGAGGCCRCHCHAGCPRVNFWHAVGCFLFPDNRGTRPAAREKCKCKCVCVCVCLEAGMEGGGGGFVPGTLRSGGREQGTCREGLDECGFVRFLQVCQVCPVSVIGGSH